MRRVVASYCTIFLKPEMLHVYRQVTGLRRYRTFVVTKTRDEAERYPFDDVVTLGPARKNFVKRFIRKYLQRKPSLIYRGEYDTLMAALRPRKPDLMHIYFGHTGVHLLPFIRESGLPCIVSFHGADVMPRKDKPGYEAQLRELLQTLPLVLARSRSLAERLEAFGCPPGKIRLNRTGIPLDDFPVVDRPMEKPNGRWCIVQACRLIEKKGLRTSLRAFAEIHREFPSATFEIAGEGPMLAELQTLASELGIAKAVCFRGFVDQTQLRELFTEADIFLHPSEVTSGGDQEGIPNAMLEAMATGLPVVATNHGGIPEAVTHGADGLLVSERDSAALTAALRGFLQNPVRMRQFGVSAASSVRREFDPTTQIARLEAAYDELRGK
ncbi:MAG TPA: glycosyltransferase [Chthoniobacterales bacterium]